MCWVFEGNMKLLCVRSAAKGVAKLACLHPPLYRSGHVALEVGRERADVVYGNF